MVNQEVEGVIGKLRACRTTFYVLSALSLLFATAMCIFASVSIREATYSLTAVFVLFAMLFLSFVYIFIREDRVLSGIIAEVNDVDGGLVITTIFSKQTPFKSPHVLALGPEWIRRRRVWPQYFLRGVDAIQYARKPSKIVKAVLIQEGK